MARSTILLALLGSLVSATALAQPFEEGTHFQRIDGPNVPIEDRVEVIEAFAYPCGACRNFLPHITSWEEQLPDYVDLQRRPVPLQQGWELFVLGFYTAQVMGLPFEDVHEAVFNAIHDERQRIRNLDDLADIYVNNSDISAESFVNTAQSFAVDSNVRKNQSDLVRFGVRSTPTVIVQGKWRVSPNGFSSYDEMLAAIDFLVEREAAELGLNVSESGDEDSVEADAADES